jgi:lipoprotein-anchoring transpeptidase ErfK/SrfK
MFRVTLALLTLLCLLSGVARADVAVFARISLSDQRMRLYVYGERIGNWPVSTGLRGYRTPTGSYRPYFLSRNHRSSKYEDAPMPYSVFFRGDYAIHGTYDVRRLGRPASHGCIRLAPRNAARFFQLIQQFGKRRTRIVITR